MTFVSKTISVNIPFNSLPVDQRQIVVILRLYLVKHSGQAEQLKKNKITLYRTELKKNIYIFSPIVE